MSEDPQGPQCEGYDNETKLRCTETRTKLYQLPGKPPSLQKRWFCQPHGVMVSPAGGGIADEKGKLHKVVSWKGSGIIVEKQGQEAAVKTRPEKPEE